MTDITAPAIVASSTAPVIVNVDLTAAPSPLRQSWQWCVGSGHATLALRADWQAQLTQAKADLDFKYVRFHGILDDDMGTLICQNDQPLYSFFNIDRIFDFLLSIGMKPLVELSFMPRMLSSGGDIVFHYQGNITPPKSIDDWSELIFRLVFHLVDRYGIDEVSQWPFECWNEPNLKAFWSGDQAAYFALYRTTAEAIKRVDSRLQIGGPVTAGNAWLDEFSHFCEASNVPVDFLSTHYYPTDPFGAIDSDTITQLEHSPHGVMRERALEARSIAGKLPLYYTEWSISSNPRDPFHDGSFAAAFALRIAMSVDAVVDGYSYWTFSDIFEENYFPSVPFHGGFGMMNLYGIPKPIYRAFQMIKNLGSSQIVVPITHATIAAWISGDTDKLTSYAVLINQALPRHPVIAEHIRLCLKGAQGKVPRAVIIHRIDADHTNPERAWHEMGAQEYLSPAQVATLMAASQPVAESLTFTVVDGTINIDMTLAPQSVNQVSIEWTT
jgi:xylan 1,4-beta-xylosidase